MPVIHRTHPNRTQQESELQASIEQELREDNEQGDLLIIDEPSGPGNRHLYVIWDDLEPLDQYTRSSIILDAYSAVYPERAREVTISMGLTYAEAARMNIYRR